MVRPNVNLDRFKYKISDLTITYNGAETELIVSSSCIKNFLINSNFENNVISSYKISLSVPKNNYQLITTHMDSLTVTFTINKIHLGYVYDNSKSEYGSSDMDIEYGKYTLKAINEHSLNTSNINRLPTDEVTNVETSDTADYTESLLMLDLYLYDADKMEKYKINSSINITGSMNDCVYQMFKKRNFKKVLMDPISSSYRSYCVPYGHLGENLKKLNDYYGIYDKPYLFYMANRRTYLINKGNLGRCLEKGELGTVNIYLEKLDDTSSANATGSYCDNENGMYILSATSFNINDNDTAIDYLAGGKITTVVRGSGKIQNDTIGIYNVEKTYVVENDKHHSQLLYSINESKRNVVIDFSNADLDIFTPNKLFAIIPDSTYFSNDYNVSGNYRLVGLAVAIQRQAEDDFKTAIQVTLNKIN